MEKINLYIENNKQFFQCDPGISLSELSNMVSPGCKYPVLAALEDNMLKELSEKVYTSHTIEFVDYTHPDGRRTYVRSLCFLLQRAVSLLYPDITLFIDYALPNGMYGELRRREANGSYTTVPACADTIAALLNKMKEMVKEDLPFVKEKMENSKAAELFRANGQFEKSDIVSSMDKFFVSVYSLGDSKDTFYGPLLPSTGALKIFDLIPYQRGFCLQSPSANDPEKISEYRYQDKLSEALRESAQWNSILGANGIASVNSVVNNGNANMLIALSESLHERKYAAIADMIHQRKSVKLVLIAGPSSSGKTTTSMRIALQCKVLGLNPKVIAMDDYFVDREHTPLDENGEYDFESIYALDLPFLSEQLNMLFDGVEVELPKFDFKLGKRVPSGVKMKMGPDDILIMEGIHALNPELTKHIDSSKVFRVFASALTSLSIDENNYISTADNRMLRRMVRDNSNRGVSPESTILRWASVRRGEERNIFPFQENADVIFNSSLLFELPLLKYYAEPLLNKIPPLSPAYSESVRMLKFLSYITPLTPEDIRVIPPTSIMREFIGGSTFKY